MKKDWDFYFVGNAHLDPVWMWQWQDGSCTAKGTIRSALDRMKEYPDFVFVCAASRVFEWIEEFCPEMFREIQERVKEGRFCIVGGWYVQPDCNNPSGESFARHSLYAQRYFKEKFGVTARTGYNVDSFGHCGTIPQILRKSGMDQYIFMRPNETEKHMPSHAFIWRAKDGSEVTACRLTRMYSTTRIKLNDYQQLLDELDVMEPNANPEIPVVPFFYGVGNHGGGPTKKNIEIIEQFRREYVPGKVHFSNLQDMFDALAAYKDKMPVHEDDLQHHAAGCYATVTPVKIGIRRSECALYGAEIFTRMVNTIMGKPMPENKEFEHAWKNVLFAQFHDSMGGCSIQAVHEDTVRSLGETRCIAARMENNALQTLTWKIDTRDMEKGFPIFLFNPHPYPVRETVNTGKYYQHIFDESGKELPLQYTDTVNRLVRKEAPYDTLFQAEIPAMGYTCYYYKNDEEPRQFEELHAVSITENTMENENLKVVFDTNTGTVISLVSKKTGREIMGGLGGVPVVIDESDHDTWSHAKNYFDREIGTFRCSEMKIMDAGPLRVTMRCKFHWGQSDLRLYYSLDAGGEYLDVKAKLFWHETRKMLKLRYETNLKDPTAWYEIPFGMIDRPCNGEEEPGLMWIAARDQQAGLAMLNDSRYSFSVKDGALNLTAIRSPFFIDHGRGSGVTDECDVTEQGEHVFRYALRPMEAEESFAGIARDAKHFNLPCTMVIENCHEGALPRSFTGLEIDRENILISAIKNSEDGKGIILRAWETAGQDTDVTFRGAMLPAPLTAHFGAHSVNTYKYENGTWREVLMTEYEME